MYNYSQDDEKEFNPADIEFDDVEIEKLQDSIQKDIDENPIFASKKLETTEHDLSPDYSNLKKYIIYINPENVDYMENLSLKDRKLIINDILNEQNIIYAKNKARQKRKHFLTQVFTICMTIVIGFPILFFIVNKSMELTIGNYKEAQKNFEKLYRKTGKVQNQDMKKLDKYTY